MNTEEQKATGEWVCKEEIFLELAKLSQQSIENRRSHEWKIAFGLWTGIGVLTFFAIEHPGTVSGGSLIVLALAYIVLSQEPAFLKQDAIRFSGSISGDNVTKIVDKMTKQPWRMEMLQGVVVQWFVKKCQLWALRGL